MAGFLAKMVGKKIFGETLENKFGAKDPIFEQIPATRLDGKPNGKFKKVRRALPPGISEHDAQILTKVKKRAYKLDLSLFSFLGVRFGWSSVIGIFPVVGDAADFLLALMVINTAKQVEGGLPSAVKMKMYIWALVDLVIGFIPGVGDVADAIFKANSRNSIILEDYLREKGKANLRASGVPIPEVDPSAPEEFDRLQSEVRNGQHASTNPGPHDNVSAGTTRSSTRQQSSGVTPNNAAAPAQPARPAQARVPEERSGSGGFFGFGGGRKSRPADVEMGRDDQTTPKRSSRR